MSQLQAIQFLSTMETLDFARDCGWIMFAVELKSQSRMIGEVGIYIAPSQQVKGDVGWSFNPAFHGQGYASEAAKALLAYAFSDRSLHRVTSTCFASNTASFRLMERIGMRREGHYLQSGLLRGEWHDELSYGLLRDEWLEVNRPEDIRKD